MKHEMATQPFTDLTDYYEILDLKPDASPNEIRESYLRMKATYQKDNVALYTLIDTEDREEMLRRIEEAYQVLSNTDRRREYDRFYGQISVTPPSQSPVPGAKIISIDRTAPMESGIGEESILVSPKTDFDFQAGAIAPASVTPNPPAYVPGAGSQPKLAHSEELEKEISAETEWSGTFLRKVREGRGISIEEITQATKITKAYILAIEDENYSKLPAPVFIRGFVAQIAKALKLPHGPVSTAYMQRAQRTLPEKFK